MINNAVFFCFGFILGIVFLILIKLLLYIIFLKSEKNKKNEGKKYIEKVDNLLK